VTGRRAKINSSVNKQLDRLINDFPSEEVLAASVLLEDSLMRAAENTVLWERKLAPPLAEFEEYEQLHDYEARRRFLLQNDLVSEKELRQAALNLLRSDRRKG
jgi:hypothetical protein